MWMTDAKRSDDWNHTARLCAVTQVTMAAEKISSGKFKEMVTGHHPYLSRQKKELPKHNITILKDIFCAKKREGNPSR